MTDQPHEAGVPADGLPAAFITCTAANPDYYVTIKTRTLKDAQRWHDEVLELDRSRRSAPETGAGEAEAGAREIALEAAADPGLTITAVNRTRLRSIIERAIVAAIGSGAAQPLAWAYQTATGVDAIGNYDNWQWRTSLHPPDDAPPGTVRNVQPLRDLSALTEKNNAQ